MPIPNLLNKYGIKEEAKTTKKSGLPNLIESKYKNFEETPAPTPVVPPAKPGLLSRAGSAIKSGFNKVSEFVAGAAQDPVYNTGSKKEILKNLPNEIVRTILPGAAAINDNQEEFANISNKEIAKELPGAAFQTAVAPALSFPLTFYGETSKRLQQLGLDNAPGASQSGAVKINTPLGPITNVQSRIEDAPVPTTKLGTAASVGMNVGFELLNGLFTASMAGKVVNPRLSRLTPEKIPITKGPLSQSVPKTGQLYDPIGVAKPVSLAEFRQVTQANGIFTKVGINESQPIIFIAKGNKGQFYQIKPSFLDEFIGRFKGDPTKVPQTQLVPVTAEVAAPKAPVAPTPTVLPAPVVPKPVAEAPKPVVPEAPKPVVEAPKKLTIQPEVPTKPEPTAKIGDKTVVRPEQLVTKTQVKDMMQGIGQDSVDFNVEEIDGKKYLTYTDDKTDMRLRPSALGLVETNITPGQVVNINTKDLKVTGTGFRAVNEAGGVEASLAGDLSNPNLPAKSPNELAKMIEQLNKLGQTYGITRKTGGVSKRALGHFAYGKRVKEPKGKVELRDETVMNPKQYMSTLSHELGHAIDYSINGNTKNSINVFGKNLPDEVVQKIIQELRAVTNDLVGIETAMAKPGYYYNRAELLARFLEKMFVSPGNIAEIAPTAVEYFDKASINHPIIDEFLQAVQGAIDKGQLKRIAFRDMRQTYQKALGKRAGDTAWNHEVNYRAMKERAKIQIEKLVNDKFKNVDDDPELIFNAVESIKSTRPGIAGFGESEVVYEFGTRDFANATPDEAEKLLENGYEPVMLENGKQAHDLVNGKLLPKFAKVRYTPEQGQAFFDKLSPEGQKLVTDFTMQRENAKDYFNREVIKDVHKINSDIEGWVHRYWKDTGPGVGGKTLKTKQASATRKRKGAEGYEKNLKEAMLKALTEINTTEAYNKFIAEFFPTVTKPIAKDQEPEDGWIEVFGNIYKGGVGTAGETRTVVIKDGESFSANKPRYQMPKDIYKRYQMLKEPAEDANSMMRVLNSVMRYWRVNILFHMGSNSTNAISGGLQYSAKIIKDFYSEVLTGDITMPQTRSNIYAMITTLTPKGWQNAPDWIYGNDLSNSYGQFTGSEKHPGIEVLDKGVDAYADKALKVYGLVERYWKKVIMNSEGVKDLSRLNMITKEGLKLPTKEEQELIALINEQVDMYGLDYDNVPVQLAQYKRGVLGQALKPFAVFPYKITKMYMSMIEAAFDGTKSWQDRLSSIMALGTMVGIAAWVIEERRKKQLTPIVGDNAPSSVKAAGRTYLTTDDEGREMFTKISKYPFINVAEAGIQASDGNIDAAYQVVRDMIGSVGPGGQVLAALFGYKSEYQQYMPPSVIAGQALSSFVPASRILNDIAAYKDPYQRKQQTFLQGFTSFYPTSDPELQEKLRGKIRTVQIPLEAGVRPAGDMEEGTRRTTTDKYVRNYQNDILLQALAGIYIKRIDPTEAEAFNVRAEKNAAKADGKTPLNPFYSK